jgi:hypothetical protein
MNQPMKSVVFPLAVSCSLAWLSAACRTTNGSSSVKDDLPNTGGNANAGGSTTGVLEHHNRATRDGLYVDAAFTRSAAAGLHRDQGFNATFKGDAYAQPLFVDNGPQGKAAIIVATESNDVFAFDANTGAQLWTKNLGPSVPQSTLPCGNIDPVGITGTPAIDGPSRTIVLDAMIAADDGSPHHKIFALAVEDGSIKSGYPVDVTGKSAGGSTFDSSVQNQRGALTILGGTAYVPYGGHWGDCGTYHGWVVGVPLNNPGNATAWATRAQGGGAWAPGGVASDGTSLYVATGNTFGADTWSDGEGLIRLQSTPSFSTQDSDYFAPSNWSDLDANDTDVGGSGPLILHVDGAQPADLALGLGKDGMAYLVDRGNMGGIGHPLAAQKVNSGQIITAAAAYQTPQGAYAVFHGYSGTGVGCPSGQSGTVVGLKIAAAPETPPTVQVAWCANATGKGAPSVTSTDGQSNTIVWVVSGTDGQPASQNVLLGINGETGKAVFGGGGAAEKMTRVRRFQPPIVAHGRIYVLGDNQVYAFKVN